MQFHDGTLPTEEFFPVLTFFMRLPAVHKKKMNKSLCLIHGIPADSSHLPWHRCGTMGLASRVNSPQPPVRAHIRRNNKGIFFSGDLWYNTYIYDFREAHAMTFIKVLFTILVCVPLVALAGWMFGKLVDEVAKKK